MLKIFHKPREYPIIRDEYGRSARQQAFALFTEGYRPAQIFKENLVPVPINILFRYLLAITSSLQRHGESVILNLR